MRTLEQEIAYCREKGFHRNDIELSTMYAWIGERASEDKELMTARQIIFQLRDSNIRIQDTYTALTESCDSLKRRNEWLEAEVKALKDALRAYGDEDDQ